MSARTRQSTWSPALLAFSASVVLVIAAGKVQAETQIGLRLGHVGAPNTVYDIAAKQFSVRVAELSNGQLDVRIYGSGTLGNIPQEWGQLKVGAIDLFITDPVLASMPEPKPKNFTVLSTPYLFKDQSHFLAFIRSSMFEDMMAKVEEAAGIRYIGYLGNRPPRALTTTDRLVENLSDVKGLKIRVGTRNATTIWKAWGANPMPLPAEDIYFSLRSGLVEAQENPILYSKALHLEEVQQYFIALDYIRSGIAVWMNGVRWGTLSETDRRVLTLAAAQTATFINEDVERRVQAVEQLLQNANVTLIRPDISQFADVAERVALEELDGKLWEKNLYTRIKAIATEREN